jgi:hypothetical protein
VGTNTAINAGFVATTMGPNKAINEMCTNTGKNGGCLFAKQQRWAKYSKVHGWAHVETMQYMVDQLQYTETETAT